MQELTDALARASQDAINRVAGRFNRSSVPRKDLVQVAWLGFFKALERFDPAVGGHFYAFAWPTVKGELKHYMRDLSPMIHVPRELKVLYSQIYVVSSELEHKLQRKATDQELADAIGVEPADIREAIMANAAGYVLTRIDPPASSDNDDYYYWHSYWHRVLGAPDKHLELVDDVHGLRPYIGQLDERRRTILHMRFFRDMTQTEIAIELGISQMHVSRLLSSTLAELRKKVLQDAPTRPSSPRSLISEQRLGLTRGATTGG